MAQKERHEESTNLRKLAPADVPTCLDLWVDSMSSGFEDRLVLSNAAAGTDGYIGLVVEDDGTVVGFGAGHVGLLADSISLPYRLVTKAWLGTPTDRIFYLDVVVVDAEYRSRGIGTGLHRKLYQQAQGFDLPIVAETWERDGPDGAAIVEKTPMARILYRSDYWTYSTTECAPCPECKSTPCSCAGALYGIDPTPRS